MRKNIRTMLLLSSLISVCITPPVNASTSNSKCDQAFKSIKTTFDTQSMEEQFIKEPDAQECKKFWQSLPSSPNGKYKIINNKNTEQANKCDAKLKIFIEQREKQLLNKFLTDGKSCENSQNLLALATFQFLSKAKNTKWNPTACRNALKYAANQWIDENVNNLNNFNYINYDIKGKPTKSLNLKMDLGTINKVDAGLITMICNPEKA